MPRSGEHRDGLPLGLEDGVLDVTEVLSVRVQREGDVTPNLDPVEVVPTEEPVAAARPLRTRAATTDGIVAGATATGATKSSPRSKSAPRTIGSGSRPAYV